MQYRSNDAVTGTRLIEKYDGSNFVVQNPPQPPLERDELDELYSLDYMRDYHPCYEKDGGIPAIEEVKFSITANRGCFGGCAFCAITYHQGREVRSRSQESIVEDATREHLDIIYAFEKRDENLVYRTVQKHVENSAERLLGAKYVNYRN